MKRLLACLRGQAVDRTPVWIMRQAGRYLPEYRASRQKAGSFLALCKTPELACEVSLQPVARFPQLDAVIVFSDILTIPDSMGLGLEFIEGSGPRFRRPVREAADIANLAVPDVQTDLAYIGRALSLVSQSMDRHKTLIGFCGSPWTMACYMVANDKQTRLEQAVAFLDREKSSLHKLLSILSVACADYLSHQVEAGAEVVQIFDTWGGVLEDGYPEHSLAYIKRTLDLFEANLRDRGLGSVPVILYTQAGEEHYDAIADSGLNGLSVPDQRSLARLRRRYADYLVLQGNLNPAILTQSDAQRVEDATLAVLDDFGPGGGHIFNLGHGITPDAKIGNVERMLDTIAPP